jgi:hypothetical protein
MEAGYLTAKKMNYGDDRKLMMLILIENYVIYPPFSGG